MFIISAILSAIAAAFLFVVTVILFVILWPALWLSTIGYRFFGDRGALWVGSISVGASIGLLFHTNGQGLSDVWSWAYFGVPPLVAAAARTVPQWVSVRYAKLVEDGRRYLKRRHQTGGRHRLAA